MIKRNGEIARLQEQPQLSRASFSLPPELALLRAVALEVLQRYRGGRQPRMLVREARSIRQLTAAVYSAASDARSEFVRKTYEASLKSPSLYKSIQPDLPVLLVSLATSKRIQLAQWLIDQPRSQFTGDLLLDLLRCSRSTAQLRSVVKGVGSGRLIASGGRGVRELCATSVVSPRICAIELPLRVPSTLPSARLDDRIADISEALKQASLLLRRDPSLERYRGTAYIKNMLTIVRRNQRLCSHLSQIPRSAEKIAKVQALLTKIRLEFKYGIAVTTEGDVQWKASELRDVARTIHLFPRLVVFPVVKGIALVSKCSEDEFASCDSDGVISFSRKGLDSGAVRDQLPSGASHLRWLTAHEVAHAVHQGQVHASRIGRAVGKWPDRRDPTINFGEFAAISGWRVHPRGTYKITDRRQAAEINGKKYVLDEPVSFGGRSVVLSFDSSTGRLVQRDSNADWMLGRYSRQNADEDYAESLACYLHNPESLISTGARKFLFFEEEFRRYHKDRKLQQLLVLATDSGPTKSVKARVSGGGSYDRALSSIVESQVATEYLIALFSRLRLKEKSWIVAQLLAVRDASTKIPQVYARYHDFKSRSPEWLERIFSQTLKHDRDLRELAHVATLDVLKGYHPALLSLMVSFHKGRIIEVLTARSNRDGNSALVRAVEEFLGFPFRRSYFVNDQQLSARLSHLQGIPPRKTQIAIDHARGWCFTNVGERLPFSRPSGYKVLVLEDEKKTIEHLSSAGSILKVLEAESTRFGPRTDSNEISKEATFVAGRIKAIDATSLDHEKLYRALMMMVVTSRLPPPKLSAVAPELVYSRHCASTVVLCDLDGTLVETDARVVIRSRETGEITRELTQAEFSGLGAVSFNSSTDVIDFGDFSLPHRVELQAASEKRFLRGDSKELRKLSRLSLLRRLHR